MKRVILAFYVKRFFIAIALLCGFLLQAETEFVRTIEGITPAHLGDNRPHRFSLRVKEAVGNALDQLKPGKSVNALIECVQEGAPNLYFMGTIRSVKSGEFEVYAQQKTSIKASFLSVPPREVPGFLVREGRVWPNRVYLRGKNVIKGTALVVQVAPTSSKLQLSFDAASLQARRDILHGLVNTAEVTVFVAQPGLMRMYFKGIIERTRDNEIFVYPRQANHRVKQFFIGKEQESVFGYKITKDGPEPAVIWLSGSKGLFGGLKRKQPAVPVRKSGAPVIKHEPSAPPAPLGMFLGK